MPDFSRERSCTGKVRHATRRSARKHARGLNQRQRKTGKYRVAAYRCDYCGGYHVGHQFDGTVREARRKECA
ncbi:MAG: hypothetical protein AAGD32_05220 [Planctomycetota bacterium]